MISFLKSTDTGIFLIRIAVGFLLPFHGLNKIFTGIDWMPGLLSQLGLPSFIGYGVYIGEIVAPLFVLFGFRTRVAALIVCFNMFMAVLLAHRHEIFTLKEAGGAWSIELDALFFLGALSLFFMGGGKFAISKKSKWD
jgi:putative oxidoreductase